MFVIQSYNTVWFLSAVHDCVFFFLCVHLPSVHVIFTFIQEEPQEIIKPVPITHPAPSTAFTKPQNQASPAYNKTARPFGGGSTSVVTASSSPAAPKVASIPSESSAFTPAAPSQPPQPPFALKSSSAAANSAPKMSPGHSAFTSPSASSTSSNSSSQAKVTAPSSHPKVPQSSVYNTPINLYSNTNASEVAMGQRRGLLESQGLSEHVNGYVPLSQPSIVFL